MKNKYKQFVYFMFLSLSFSQSIQDLQRLKSEYEKFQKGQSKLQVPEPSRSVIDSESGLPMKKSIAPYTSKEDSDIIKDKSRHFGYDFFTSRDSIAFWENLPTPSNYLLGSGDELIITLWGETQLRNEYTISREGKIYDEKVGLLHISGRTISEARQYLKTQFGRLYATLTISNPTTYIDISLGGLRSINVNFVGEVKYPGVYPVHPFSTVITGLIQAGGIDTTGSLRQIQIRRNNKLEKTIDLYDYFINGSSSSSIQLRDQDIILIPPRKSFIQIDSAIVRPKIYEAIEGETIYDLITHAGGPTFDASEKVSIYRVKPKADPASGLNNEGFYVDLESTKLIPVGRNDKISIRYLFDELQQVEIIGQVKVPGSYHYYKGMNLKELLTLGGGFEDSTYIKSIYLNKAEIIRRNPGSRYDKVITVNLNNILRDESKNIELKNLDRLVVHANLNFFEKANILILGEVNVPGSYPIINDGESLNSFINRAGGLTSQALENGISIYRDKKYFDTKISNISIFEDMSSKNLTNLDPNQINEESQNTANIIDDSDDSDDRIRVAWQDTKIALLPGDSIIVKEKTETVFITGEVYNPGVLEFRSGKSLRYYINSAGGLTDNANKKGIIILYANGIVKPKKWYSSPKVFEGSTIMINKKENEEPFNITQFATNWTSIISSMITAIVLSQQLN